MNEKEFYIYLGIHFKDRLRLRFKKEKGHILDTILQYEASINDRWEWYKEQYLKKVKDDK